MKFCPKCGRERQIQLDSGLGVKFCDQCGHKFDEVTATAIAKEAEKTQPRGDTKNRKSSSQREVTRKTKTAGTSVDWQSLIPSEGSSGWFSDPLKKGRLRFWNGVDWTDEIATVVVSSLNEDDNAWQSNEVQSQVSASTSAPKRHVLLEGLGYGNNFVEGSSCYNCGVENLSEAQYCERCGVEI